MQTTLNEHQLSRQDFLQGTLRTKVTTFNFFLGLVILLGIFFRLFHFFDNRSLWNDEVYLANSLIRMGYAQLATLPLEYEQKAPIGYLWGVKTFVLLLGKKEMALRLFSLIGGIASLFIFLPVCRKFLRPVGIVVAMGILSLAPPIIYHSVEAKQYGIELLATVIALRLYVVYRANFGLKPLLLWGIYGAVLVWFSYSVIFILAGMAVGICLHYLVNKNYNKLFLSAMPGFIWLLSFCVNYYLFTYKNTGSEWLTDWFRGAGGFMPFPPTSVQDIKWLPQTIYRMMDYPLGLLWNFITVENPVLRIILKMPVLSIGFFMLGIWAFWKTDNKTVLTFLFAILLFLFASAMELYPFFERFLVFLSPILILFIAIGCQYLVTRFYGRGKWVLVLPVLLLAGPLITSAREVFNTDLFGGYKKEYFKEVFLFINNRYKPGDEVYVYWNLEQGYRYYKKAYQFKYNAVQGSDQRPNSESVKEYISNLQPELKPLADKKRVWLVYHKSLTGTIGDVNNPHKWYLDKRVSNGRIIQSQFNKIGRRVLFLENPNIFVGLYVPE